jgi:hypothetical protein
MNMTMTLNPNGISHAATTINPQPGMGLMALMATTLPPTQMSVLPSIVDASKAAVAPTEAGKPLLPLTTSSPTTNGNGVATGSVDEVGKPSATVKPPNGSESRHSLTMTSAAEKSPTGSQILVPTTLRTMLSKVSVNGEATTTQAPPVTTTTFNNNNTSTPALAANTNGKTPPGSQNRGSGTMMLTVEDEGVNESTASLPFSLPTAPLAGTVANNPSLKSSDSYDPEEDIMYRV